MKHAQHPFTESRPVAPPMVSGRLPVLGHVLEFMRDPQGVIRRGYEEHGLIFTIDLAARKGVVMLGPDYHQFFFKETDGVFSMRQGYETLLKMFDSRLFTFAHLTESQEQMKVLLPLLKNNDRFISLMEKEVDDFMQDTMGVSGDIDLVDAFGPLVMHIGAHAFFGEDFRYQLGAEYFAVYREFSQGADVVLPSWLPLAKFRKSRNAKARIETMIYEFMQKRRETPREPKDLFQELIESTYYDNKPVPDGLLISMLLFIPWAAHETTVGHVAWTLINLLQNPKYFAQVREELTHVFAEDRSLTPDALKQLKTLDWAILESERLHPVAHVIMRGVRDDMIFEEYEVKKGSMVFVAPATAHNIPEVFQNPNAYDPVRFSPERSENSKKFSLIGFGGGAHRCAGVNFAKMEIKIIIAKLLLNYDIELIDKDPQPKPGVETKWPESPCRIRFRRLDT
ncbi:Lanosterol 14-alpha demethylase [BD1-7 clade bacterium]|uniref:Lanosterol 14-alpha demethylase n=1 Tax=BD1-7 clade bacterium TaxID=2029982 RepID=A0A5S9Q4T8_9GAMM|nr:Lanosterol 14-alpha demethylase [BD1-7 clade bacterium]CAA0112739.1 Lanosterol 14-alpha demethylase [BD1-7 clade bacterium]